MYDKLADWQMAVVTPRPQPQTTGQLPSGHADDTASHAIMPNQPPSQNKSCFFEVIFFKFDQIYKSTCT